MKSTMNTDVKNAMNNFKNEVAKELGVNLKDENLTAKDAGRIGGEMTKRLVGQAKKTI